MPTVTVFEVPDALAARAARQRKSLQEYLYDELARLANRPSIADLMADVGRRKRLTGRHVSRESILAARDADRR
jgi:antitoxin FitA